MKLAIPFFNHFELNDTADEFNIFFDPDENSFEKLLDFLEMFQEKKVNVEYRAAFDIKTASALYRVSDNVRFRLRAEHMGSVRQLKEKGIPYFYDSSLACVSWCDLKAQVELEGVCCVYIADDLVYQLSRVSKYCKDHNVEIRVILNRIPMTRRPLMDSRVAMVYRPNDYDLLSKYYDVAEFDCGKPYDFKTLKVLYKFWFIKNDWFGDLKEINHDLTFSLPNRSIPEPYTFAKINCGLKCLRGSSCNKCDQLTSIALGLNEMHAQWAKKRK